MPMTPLPKGTTPDEEVVCCAIHSVTEREHVDVGTERGHRAADVGAEGQRQRLAEAALAFADQPVPRPHARRLHSDQHLARPRHRTGNLVEPHGVDAAGFMNSNGSHHSPPRLLSLGGANPQNPAAPLENQRVAGRNSPFTVEDGSHEHIATTRAEPKVCRLPAGGRWIRTSSTAAQKPRISAAFPITSMLLPSSAITRGES